MQLRTPAQTWLAANSAATDGWRLTEEPLPKPIGAKAAIARHRPVPKRCEECRLLCLSIRGTFSLPDTTLGECLQAHMAQMRASVDDT
jgi:hypothetical protein